MLESASSSPFYSMYIVGYSFGLRLFLQDVQLSWYCRICGVNNHCLEHPLVMELKRSTSRLVMIHALVHRGWCYFKTKENWSTMWKFQLQPFYWDRKQTHRWWHYGNNLCRICLVVKLFFVMIVCWFFFNTSIVVSTLFMFF